MYLVDENVFELKTLSIDNALACFIEIHILNTLNLNPVLKEVPMISIT